MQDVATAREAVTTNRKSSLIVEDITAIAAALPGFAHHEQVLLGRDDERGLTAIIAIHDTTLGPALGGTRIWMHESFDAAVTDALRLSQGMTLKAAIAGLPLGGGKAVIRADPKRKSPEMLDAYAEMLAEVQDVYITAEDVGMTLADADYLHRRTPNVAGTTAGGSGNPSRFTAEGVFLGIRAALRHVTSSADLNGRHVAIQGLGAVGWALAERLRQNGATLTVTDIDPERCREATAKLGALTVSPEEILTVKADVFSPCALGAVISAETISGLKSRIVAGAANNQLLHPEDANRLAERDILYAPDYVINAGGLINVAAEMAAGGYNRKAVMDQIAIIPETLSAIFTEADRSKKATNEVALQIAQERIAAGAVKRH